MSNESTNVDGIKLRIEKPEPPNCACPGGCERQQEPFHFVIRDKNGAPAKDSKGQLLPSGWVIPCCEPCLKKHYTPEPRRKGSLLRRMGLVGMLQDMTFGSWRSENHHQDRGRRIAVEFANRPVGTLWLTGTRGSGKTHLAVAIARARMTAGTKIVFAYVPLLLDDLREDYLAADTPGLRDSKWSTADLLILDDLGVQKDTEFSEGRLNTIINERSIHERPTIITSNLNPEEATKLLDDRMISRLAEGATVIDLGEADYRIESKKRKPRGRDTKS